MAEHDDIIQLLENETELTPELLALIEEYRQVKEESTLPYAIGSRCAITFAVEEHLVLLPAIVLSYNQDNTIITVIVLTPLTENTVPCTDYFESSCERDDCPRSHGYALPAEYVTSFDALEITDMTEQLQYGKRVWCKEEQDDVWKLANIVDQLHGPRWRVRLRDKTRKCFHVDIEHVMPFKSVLDDASYDDEQEEWSESDRESVVEESDNTNNVIPDGFGEWEVYSTGFASKMMKKMGYVEGKGLGVQGEGRVEPVQAYKSQVRDLNSRPGLGLELKKKKKPQRKLEKKNKDQVFELLNSLNTTSKMPENSVKKPTKFKTDREANVAIAKLQDQVDKAQKDHVHASEAYRRNKGYPTEDQFRTKLKKAVDHLDLLKKELSQLQRHVKQTKEKKDMYTF